jgi:catechol 2,3-dioxygenase-like lactoylglutathione lyase family enzyme
MSAVPSFGSVVLDCPDPAALAAFYARLLDWPPAEVDDENSWVTLNGPGVKVEFQRADDYLPPTWPKPERQQMFHLDLTVDDLPAAHDRALELGARHLDTQRTFRVYADPAGHPFCLCAC